MKLIIATILALTVAFAAAEGNNNNNNMMQPCGFAGISSQGDCYDACDEIFDADVTATYSNGMCSCTSSNGTIAACNNDDPAGYVLSLLAQFAPASCMGVFDQAVSNGLVSCFSDEDSLFGEIEHIFDFEEEFDGGNLCDNMCLHAILGAANIFSQSAEAMECGQYLNMLGQGSEHEEDDGHFNLTDLLPIRNRLNVYCAEGGVGFCGDLAGLLNQVVFLNETVTASNCSLINDRGFCLGNIKQFLNMHPIELEDEHEGDDDMYEEMDRELNGTVFINMLTASCMAEGIDITLAASSVEASANISSGSFVTGSFFAILAASLVALLFH